MAEKPSEDPTGITYHDPKPTDISHQSIRYFAEKLGKQVSRDFNRRDGISAVKMAGGKIVYRNAWQCSARELNSIRVAGVKDFTIYVGVGAPDQSDNFTIAHELAHYFLHFLLPWKRTGIPLPIEAKLTGEEIKVEQEANLFASAYLMPVDQVLAVSKSQPDDTIERVSQKFNVPNLNARSWCEYLEVL